MASVEVQPDRNALTAFVVENRDLERLEALLDRFNIFEAIGVVRQELRHSDFLSFLLNPQANHGLGDLFVKRLLQRVLRGTEDTSVPVTPIDLELRSLNQMEIRREWQRIDILLLDASNRLAVIIENKIGTDEHSDQLRRYHRIVNEHYPGWQVIGLYLTPSGEAPSYEAYLPVDYGSICDVMGGLAESRVAVASPDLKTLIAHYTEMLRRRIVGDSEIARLCQQIYKKHRQALDLIYEHRPDNQALIKDLLEALIKDEPGLKLDGGGKTKPRFAIQEWDTPALLTGSGWTRSGRILMFEFWNYPDGLWLLLLIGPGSDETRQKLFDMVRANPDVFDTSSNLGNKWSGIFTRTFLEQGTYSNTDHEDREREIRKHWAEFIEKDLPQIDTVLKKEQWIWQHLSDADKMA